MLMLIKTLIFTVYYKTTTINVCGRQCPSKSACFNMTSCTARIIQIH